MKQSETETKPAGPGSQLEAWTGQFGDEYLNRNDYEDWKLKPGTLAFQRILGGLDIGSVLEVGSSIGLNLIFIDAALEGQARLFAVEPNRKAFDKLTSQPDRLKLDQAWNCSAFKLPPEDSSIDLVFTTGVLIHIDPEDLGRATDEIVRVSRRYVLCMEYFSDTPVEKTYRGQQGLLFKRDFGAWYQDRYPNLTCLRYGFIWKRELPVFDNVNWWLFGKKQTEKS